MAKRVISIGNQDFESIRKNGCFYVDKTDFIREWWENQDSVTLITRPRRFGKTLNMSMLNYFFSNRFADRPDLFEGLSVWEDEQMRKLQGTYPVIFLSFAWVKETTYEDSVAAICDLFSMLFDETASLLNLERWSDRKRQKYEKMAVEMTEREAKTALKDLSIFLRERFGKKVLILLDEYDTPLQEAYVGGYWDEMAAFIRVLFNNTFKTNPCLERAVMTGITRVSKESIFSDLNNLRVLTTTSEAYATAFGFTEEEVFAGMYLGMKNDVSVLVSDAVSLYRKMELYEQQSTPNPNMPVREFMYAGKLYDKFLHENRMNRYGRKLLPLPVPKLIVFYNGEDEAEDEHTMRLSDAFKEEIRRKIKADRDGRTGIGG